MSIYLREKLKSEIEDKYKINFNELEVIGKSIKDKYYVDENIKLLFEIYLINNGNDDYIVTKCFKRFKTIEEKEYSYVSDNELYKQIEKAYELWYLLYDYINIEILWNKEVIKIYDNDYKFLSMLANIYLKETDNLVKEIDKYEKRRLLCKQEKYL